MPFALASHPNTLTKCQAEVDSVVGIVIPVRIDSVLSYDYLFTVQCLQI